MTNTDKLPLDMIYPMFLSKDKNRPKLSRIIHDEDGLAYATDGVVALRWEGDKNYYDVNAPNVKAVFEQERNYNLLFDCKEYYSWKAGLPKVNKVHSCPVCQGKGEVEWRFEGYVKTDDCPCCDGDPLTEVDFLVEDTKTHYPLWHNAEARQSSIKKLVMLARRDGLDKVELKHNGGDLAPTFLAHFSDCSMLFATSIQ